MLLMDVDCSVEMLAGVFEVSLSESDPTEQLFRIAEMDGRFTQREREVCLSRFLESQLVLLQIEEVVCDKKSGDGLAGLVVSSLPEL